MFQYRYLVFFLVFIVELQASDTITIDSLFKKSNGVRTVSEISILSNGGGANYINYSNPLAINDGTMPIQRKKLYLNETILYRLNNKSDLIFTLSAYDQNDEYIKEGGGYKSENRNSIESLFIGYLYQFEQRNGLKPEFSITLPFYQKLFFGGRSEVKSFRTLNSKLTLKQFIDPATLSYSLGYTKSFAFKIDTTDIEYPDSIFLGFDTNIILNPRLSLNFSTKQSFQNRQKINGLEVSPSSSLITFGFGTTYSLSSERSITTTMTSGVSADAPEGTMSVSVWQKF
ncbi:MAG: hypothetical protein OIF32_11495 [Campylobacterales bacterium]|nr:hypothetical protein [Campylobacterales bacterium]